MAFSIFGETSDTFINKHPKLVEFVLNRVLLRYDRGDSEPYVCFRRRIFHPTFKSRRNESVMFEKLERMSNEFNSLRMLCDSLHEKCAMESEYLAETSSILQAFHSIKLTKKQKKMYRKRILGIPDENSFIQTTFNVHSIMTNRNKIAVLRNIKVLPELFIDSKFADDILSLTTKQNTPGSNEPGKSTCKRCQNNGDVFYCSKDTLN